MITNFCQSLNSHDSIIDSEDREGFNNLEPNSNGRNNDWLKVRDLLNYPDTNSSDDANADVRELSADTSDKEEEDVRQKEMTRRKETRGNKTEEEH